jgi:hypothetical protein
MLTQERLKELLDYDQETGIFVWKEPITNISVGVVAGTLNDQGYLIIGLDNERYRAHRLAWFYVYGKWPDNQIDHRDHNRSNNRIKNLRDFTHSENNQNQICAQDKNKSTKLLGAYPNGSGFMARIQVNGKDKYLGTFRSPEAAHAAYILAKRELHRGCML